ncbi:MAG: prepilin peptidase [Methanobrevibacter sp.]|uniref:prepilin peptidase n=1 Tax=Methanobrevibacter sp. TaxID=66852 RepID=UPI0025E17EFB|nr:A24 family peptidase [Methanobrevibacter sp.]MBQ6099948.1 prepilin peptidase [Methanobrevibacter sp.]
MNISVIFLVQIIVTVLFAILASIFDVKKGIVPDRLNFLLILFGLTSNLILSLITSNVKYILGSIILMVVTYYVAYLLWQLNMWGGGDVKLFTSIATAIPFGLNIDFLNIFPELSVYPFIFSVIFNSILVSFPFLVLFTVHLILKNNIFKNNVDFLVNILNYESLKAVINSTLNKTVHINDLKEGMIVNDYVFNDEHICNLITDLNGNLKVYKSKDKGFKYYFKSQSAGGITKNDMYLLKIMYAQKFISDSLSVKISFPFTPAILVGLIIALSFGDLMMLITKHLVLVV